MSGNILSSSEPIINYKECALSATRSKLAYLEPEELNKKWKNSPLDADNIAYYVFENVENEPIYYSDSVTSAACYSWIQAKTLHIVFRGTSDEGDVKSDIDEFRTQLFPGNKQIMVHKGFFNQFNALQGHLLEAIDNSSNDLEIVHFSGHSLGGALATLAAAYFSPIIRSKLLSVICHTIGSPRVGNKAFVNWWTGKVDESRRFLNFKDPVPLLPLNGFYTHITGGLEINDACKVIKIGSDMPWYMRICMLPFEIQYKNMFANHACDLYISRLMKLADWNISIDLTVFHGDAS
jgi:hypothetical protein